MTDQPVLAEYFATIKDGKILGICSAYPHHKLVENQIKLTRQEFEFLRESKGKLVGSGTAIKAIKKKIKQMKVEE